MLSCGMFVNTWKHIGLLDKHARMRVLVTNDKNETIDDDFDTHDEMVANNKEDELSSINPIALNDTDKSSDEDDADDKARKLV